MNILLAYGGNTFKKIQVYRIYRIRKFCGNNHSIFIKYSLFIGWKNYNTIMFSNFSSLKGRLNHGLQNKIQYQDKGSSQSGSDQEDYPHDTNDNLSGLLPVVRRSLTPRMQSTSPVQQDDVTVFENEEEEKNESYLKLQKKEKENDSEGLPIDIKEKLNKLKKYEDRFPELANSYKKLLNEKKAIELVLRKNSHLEGITDVEAFEAHLRNLNMKDEMRLQEIKRITQINDETKRQIEDMCNTHKMELDSQSKLIDKLKKKILNQEEQIENMQKKESSEVISDNDLKSVGNLDSEFNENESEKIVDIDNKKDEGISQLSEEIKTIKLKNGVKIREYESIIEKSNIKIQKLEAENIQLSSDKETLKGSIQSMEKAHANKLQQLIQEYDEKNNVSVIEKKTLEKSLESLAIERDETVKKVREELEKELKKTRDLSNQHHIALDNKTKEFEQERKILIRQFEKKLEVKKEISQEKLPTEERFQEVTKEIEGIFTQEESFSKNDNWNEERKQSEFKIQSLLREIEQLKQSNSKLSLYDSEITQKRDTQVEVTKPLLALTQEENQKETVNVEESQPDRAPLSHDFDHNSNEKDELTNRVDELIEKLKYAKKRDDENQSLITKFEKQIESLTASINEKDEIPNEMHSKLNSSNELITSLYQTINEYQEKISLLEKPNNDFESITLERDQFSQKLDELKITHEELQKNYQELKSESSSVSSKTAELENRVKELNKEIAIFTKEKQSLLIDFGNLQKISNDTQAQLNDEKAAFTDLKEKFEKTKKSHILFESDNSQLKGKLKTTEEKYKLLESDCAQLHIAKTDALEKLSDVESRLKSSTQRERDLQDSLSEYKSIIQKRDFEIESLKKQLTEEKEKHSKTLSSHKLMKQKVATLEKEKKELSDEIDHLQDSLKSSEQNAAINLKQELLQFNKKLEAKSIQISHLETLNEKSCIEKDGLFDKLQVKQAEFESSQSLLENLQHGSKELTHQLKEFEERSQALEGELKTLKKFYKEKSRENENLKTKITDLIRDNAEKLENLKKQSENYRHDKEKIELELMDMKCTIDVQIQDMIKQLNVKEQENNSLTEISLRKDDTIKSLQNENESLQKRMQEIDKKVDILNAEIVNANKNSAKYRELEMNLQLNKEEYEKLLEEARMREGHLRTINKTLKDEVRKLQKSSERNASQNSPPSISPIFSRGPNISMTSSFHYANMDNDLKIDYLRDIIFKFLEHKVQRKALLPVLTTLLKVSPEEKRKLEAKYG
ncbi:hypothetical protein Glove_322g15 [Diversispora epigaea]|uniref:GRIP domain-containing protein n=1 Tax=Diversispora epigaea TaxID=1348612 RepID=A0A397HNE0_9GLOM|nr:hypothetical protein Glove_322g15 [Diversispora epigaea]